MAETNQLEYWTDEYGVQYDKEHKVLVKAPEDLVKYVIAEGTKTIGEAAFCNCMQLKSVILPNSIFEIEKAAFAGCSRLLSIAIPNRVISIGFAAFFNCVRLHAVRIPAGLRNINKEDQVFLACCNLSKVYVPKGVNYNYDELFAYSSRNVITYEYDPQDNSEIRALDEMLHGITDEEGVLYNFDEDRVLSATKELRLYRVKPGTVEIRDNAFRSTELADNAKSMKRLYLPDSIKFFGNATFAGLEELERINIPENAIFFGSSNPFAGCPNLHNIQWDSKETIKDDTLVYNKERTTLIACLNWHYADGIMQCWSLLDFARQYGPRMQVGSYYDHEGREITKCVLTPPTGEHTSVFFEPGFKWSLNAKDIAAHKNEIFVIEIGRAYFPPEGINITSPSGLNLDELSVGTFLLCSEKPAIIEQESIVRIPEGVETILDKAFCDNKVLQEIILPTTLKTIGKSTFEGCTSLRRILIPLGTRSKFETMLPEWKDKFVEKYEEQIVELSDFELPDGSIYNGSAIQKPFGFIELSGAGEISYPNGDKYNGEFKYGRPNGWGAYRFKNGHTHKGYFDNQPLGIGYLNEDYSMSVGNFSEGRLHGWAICYKNRIFKFGFWKGGMLIHDETDKTLGVRDAISKERLYYHGNIIQISKELDFIRLGIPPRSIGHGVNRPYNPIFPAIGFEFFKDGSVKYGEIRNHSTGDYVLCKPDGSMEIGHWKDDVKTQNRVLSDLQKDVDSYEVDGVDVYEK